MATKAMSLNSAEHCARKHPEKTYAIYRVGPAWMFTSTPLDELRTKYTAKIAEYIIVHRATGG